MNYKLILLFLISAFLISVFGLGKAYYREFKPSADNGAFYKIGADRWIQEGSSINLPNLSSRGNKLELKFGPWHPEGAPKAVLRAYLCGKLVSEFKAYPGSKEIIHLTGDCEPRKISFSVLNPVITVKGDTRKIGAQLLNSRVYSKLGVPIVELKLLIKYTAFLFLFFIILFYSFSDGIISSFLYFSGLMLSFLPLASIHNFELWKFDWYLFSLFFIALGMFIFSKAQADEDKEVINYSFITSLLLFPIIGLAFYLRFNGLDFGFPFRFHPDEVPKFNAISRMFQYGDLNPRYFLHPSILLYSTYFSSFIMHFGEVSRTFPELIYSGRVASMSAGVISVLLTYFIGKELFSRKIGIIASTLLAVLPLHVVSSRYVKEDAILLFFILLCTYLVLVAARKKSILYFCLAALAGGFASSTKYSGVLTICILFATPFLTTNSLKPDQKMLLSFVLVAIFLPLGFLIGTPYSLLDYGTFINDFSHEKSHMIKGHSLTITGQSQFWVYHLSRSIYKGMGSIVAIASVIGLGCLIRKFEIKTLFIVACFLLFYLPAEYVNAKPAPQPERYIVPCLPFLSIGVAYFLSNLLKLKNFRLTAVPIIFLIFFIPTTFSIKHGNSIKSDTRNLMAKWIKNNIDKGSTLFVDWKPYSPQGLEEDYNIVYLPRSRLIPSLTIDELEKLDGYLIMSSLYYDRFFNQPESPELFKEVIRTVFKEYKVLKHITNPDGAYGFHNPRLTLLDIDTRGGSDLDQVNQILEELPSHIPSFF